MKRSQEKIWENKKWKISKDKIKKQNKNLQKC